MLRKLAFALALVAIGPLAIVFTAGSARAADTPAPTTLTVIQPQDQQPGKTVTLAAKLTAKDGTPLGNQKINFYVIPGVFGPDAMMPVGSATTDGTGVATYPYKPTWIGDVKATANFGGTTLLAASQATWQFKAVGPVRGHTNATFPLAPVRNVAPWVVLGLVAAIWLTFITIVVRMVIALRPQGPARPNPTPAGEHLAGAKS